MLILTRKVGESIQIGDSIEVVLAEINKGSVRIGINAPRDMPVYRKEIYQKILQENQEAADFSLNNKEFDSLNQLLTQVVKTEKS